MSTPAGAVGAGLQGRMLRGVTAAGVEFLASLFRNTACSSRVGGIPPRSSLTSTNSHLAAGRTRAPRSRRQELNLHGSFQRVRYLAGTPPRNGIGPQVKVSAPAVSAHGLPSEPQPDGTATTQGDRGSTSLAHEPATVLQQDDMASAAEASGVSAASATHAEASAAEAPEALTPQQALERTAAGLGPSTAAQQDRLNLSSAALHDPADEAFMTLALREAEQAAARGEVPVGAVMVAGGRVIARGRNKTEALNDPTAHAEMLCIREASRKLGSWKNLKDATLYVTLEPCPMCAGALLQARVGTVVWGARNTLLGADGSWTSLLSAGLPRQPEQGPGLQPHSTKKSASRTKGSEAPSGGDELAAAMPPTDPGNHPQHPQHPFQKSLVIRRFVIQEKCSQLMKSFFRTRRARAPQAETPLDSIFKFFRTVFKSLQ